MRTHYIVNAWESPGHSPVEPCLYTITTRHTEYHILVEFSCPCDNTSKVRLLTDQQAEAEIELEQLVMKDNHKVTKFFVDFYQISTMLDHNNSSLYPKVYTAMPKRVKDELIHFNMPRTLYELRDLIQKIDQHCWEHRGELAPETCSAPATKAKTNKSARAAPNNDRRQGQNSGNSNSNSNTNAQPSGKGKEAQGESITRSAKEA
jgi:hypothetical protein